MQDPEPLACYHLLFILPLKHDVINIMVEYDILWASDLHYERKMS